MKKVMLIALLASGGLFAASCDKKSGDSGSTGTSAAPASGGGGDSIGVQECDDYIKKMNDCAGKAGPAKAAMESALKQSVDAWKQVAAGPGKDSLKSACKQMLDALANNPVCK